VSREEGPAEQPELIELADSPTALSVMGAHTESTLRDVSEAIPPAETALSLPLEPFIKVQQGGEDVSAKTSATIHPSAGTSQELSVQRSDWEIFLWREDRETVLGHGDFLRGLEKFERVRSRDQIRSLENDVFRVNLNCFSPSIG